MSSRFIVTLRFKLISGWLRGYLGLAYGLFSVGLGVFLKVGETYRKLFLRSNGEAPGKWRIPTPEVSSLRHGGNLW